MAECATVLQPLHDVDSLSVLPFYNITNFELVNSILFKSKNVRNDKLFNNTFHDMLKCNVNCNIMQELSFKFYTDDDFNHTFNNIRNTTKLSVFHLNIRSLNKNYHELYSFLHSLNVEFDVLVLSEIWSTNLEFFSNLFPGYSFYYDSPRTSSVGGVGVLVKHDYSCTILDNLKITNCNEIENIWIEISKHDCKYIIGAIYRHPNHNIREFGALLENSLSSISRRNVPCIISGDFNIDLSKYDSHTATTDYVDMLLVNNFLPVITMPSRITDSTSTIIDHIYYFEGNNCKNDFLVKSGNLWCDITDHLPNFMIITGNSSTKCVENRPLVRLFSSNNIQKFCSLVHCIDWNDVCSNDNVDVCYRSFENAITRCFDNSFPYVRLSRKRFRDKKWVTKGLKTSINHRNILYRKWLTTHNDEDAVKYKNYRTTCKLILQKAEHEYYKYIFDNKSHSIKQLWRNLNSTFSLTKNKVKTSVSKITVNDITYTAQKDICNCLNDYFCDIGKNLASGIPYQLHDFTKYCHVPNNNSMFCTPASTAEILKIISSFKDNKAPGPDNIAPKLLKLISTDVIEPLAYILNLSFSSGQVPHLLKTAKVIPLHKKGDKDKPGNYRPISLLSIFDKVLEKLMFNRMYSFLLQNDILYKYQFGFRKGFSTSLALIELLDTIYFHRDNHDFLIGMFF